MHLVSNSVAGTDAGESSLLVETLKRMLYIGIKNDLFLTALVCIHYISTLPHIYVFNKFAQDLEILVEHYAASGFAP